VPVLRQEMRAFVLACEPLIVAHDSARLSRDECEIAKYHMEELPIRLNLPKGPI
jgi:hypothetical protein